MTDHKTPVPAAPENQIQRPLQPQLDAVLSPFESFLSLQSGSGLALFGATVLALMCRNSGLEGWYQALLELPLALYWGDFQLEMTFKAFVNDGLMALLFFLLGLELKRELMAGELRDRKRLTPVVASAAGGMALPALLFLFVNRGTDNLAGWGIPIATDVAFALGVLMVFGHRMPAGLRVFLVSFALFDDLGAILVIAVFYSTGDVLHGLGPVAVSLVAIVLLNLGGIRRPWPYMITGIVLWYWLHHAGIHGTLAGVVVGLAAPASPLLKPRQFGRIVRDRMRRFARAPVEEPRERLLFEDSEKHEWAAAVARAARQATSPLRRWESALDVPVFFLVVPLFAFINAGVEVSAPAMAAVFTDPLGVGILLGLVAGKLLGVGGGAWLVARRMPLYEGFHHLHLPLIGSLAGIGFTMSMLIADLAFLHQPEKAELAISAVLVASLFVTLAAAALGLLVSRRTLRRRDLDTSTDGEED